MLPSKGYFKSLNCPYFDNGFCDRPHCHFRHSKRDKQEVEGLQTEDTEEESQPNDFTEKIVNILSDINIEEKDALFDSDKGNATWVQQQPSSSVSYKPTPIAELRKRHIPVVFSPSMTVTNSHKRRIEYDVKEVRKPKVEYIPEVLQSSHYDNENCNSSLSITDKLYPTLVNNTPHVYKATKISENSDLKTVDIESEISPVEGIAEESEEEIDFDQVSSELKFLDEILEEYENKSEDTKVTMENVLFNAISDENAVKSNEEITLKNNDIQTYNGFIKFHQNPSDKENKYISSKINEISSNDNKKHSDKKNKIVQNGKILSLNAPDSTHNEPSKCIQDQNSSSRTSSHSKGDKKISSSLKAKLSDLHKTENEKFKQEIENKSNSNKSGKNELEHTSSSKKSLHKEHSLSSIKVFKTESHSEHKNSFKSSKKESEHRTGSSKSSKNELEHKGSSIKCYKNESSHHTSHNKSLKRKYDDECISSKKRRLGSPVNQSSDKNNHSSNRNKDECKSKQMLRESISSEDERNSSKSKDHIKHKRESSDKSKHNEERRSSSSREIHRKREKEQSNGRIANKSHSNKTRSDTETEKTDDEVEIINDPVSIIIIDSEDEINSKEKYNKKKKESERTNHSLSPSLSPIFPSDNSYMSDTEDDIRDCNDDDFFTLDNVLGKTSLPVDDNSSLDHRVKSRLKTRVSLGNAWRPQTRKPAEVLTPAKRLMMFRKLKEKEENTEGQSTSTARVKIGSVPNVKLLLKEKERLLKMNDNKAQPTKANGRINSCLSYRNAASTLICSTPSKSLKEDKDEPPKITQRPHPLKVGADIYTRQRCMEMLYKAARQLVKPGRPYSEAQAKCLKAEQDVWENTKHDTYCKKMKEVVDHTKSLISTFTLKYYMSIKPRRSSEFLPELRTIKKTDEKGSNSVNKEDEISLYTALKKYVLSEEQLENEGYPRRKMDPLRIDLAYINEESLKKWKKPAPEPPRGELACVNCKKFYQVDESGLSTDPNGCSYHAKKSWNIENKRSREKHYRCCGQVLERPCMVAQYHSTETADFQNLEGFLETEEPVGQEPTSGWGVYALDCEMYWSISGLELGRVTVINPELRVVYDTCVKPDKLVTDYSTRMSGLTEENLQNARVTFSQVQQSLLKLFNSKTILIGHSLENDLKALKLIHNTVVDTAILFPYQGNKQALKNLAKDQLNEVIQCEEDGHDSTEDAITCLKIMKQQVLKEAATNKKPKAPVLRRPFPNSHRDLGLA